MAVTCTAIRTATGTALPPTESNYLVGWEQPTLCQRISPRVGAHRPLLNCGIASAPPGASHSGTIGFCAAGGQNRITGASRDDGAGIPPIAPGERDRRSAARSRSLSDHNTAATAP